MKNENLALVYLICGFHKFIIKNNYNFFYSETKNVVDDHVVVDGFVFLCAAFWQMLYIASYLILSETDFFLLFCLEELCSKDFKLIK